MTTTLTVGLDDETRDRVTSLFDSRDAEVDAAAQASDAVARAHRHRFDLVACTYPLPDMALRTFSSLLRRADSASRDAALLVLTLPDMRTEACMGLPRGRSLVMSRRAPTKLLGETVRHLLRVKPRRDISLPVTISYQDEATEAVMTAQTVNLSMSGMLVYHPELPPLTSSCRFNLGPDGGNHEVTGAGTVVRHCSLKREHVHGFAVHFSELESDAELLARIISSG